MWAQYELQRQVSSRVVPSLVGLPVSFFSIHDSILSDIHLCYSLDHRTNWYGESGEGQCSDK